MNVNFTKAGCQEILEHWREKDYGQRKWIILALDHVKSQNDFIFMNTKILGS